MRRGLLSLVAVFLCVGLIACGGNDNPAGPPAPTPTPVPEFGQYTVAVTPDPTIGMPSGNPDFPYFFNVNVMVTDTAGLSGNVSGVQIQFGNSNVFNVGASDVVRLAGTNHINTRSSIQIPVAVTYHAGGNGHSIPALNFQVGVIDDHGHSHQYIDTISVLLRDAVQKP